MVESWPKPVCCSTGDRVAVDAKVESSLLCLTILLAARKKSGVYTYIESIDIRNSRSLKKIRVLLPKELVWRLVGRIAR